MDVLYLQDKPAGPWTDAQVPVKDALDPGTSTVAPATRSPTPIPGPYTLYLPLVGRGLGSGALGPGPTAAPPPFTPPRTSATSAPAQAWLVSSNVVILTGGEAEWGRR